MRFEERLPAEPANDSGQKWDFPAFCCHFGRIFGKSPVTLEQSLSFRTVVLAGPSQFHADQGLIKLIPASSKCGVLRVARVAC
jgi:hypothetical protein